MYTMRDLNNFKLRDDNCYYLQLYNQWLDNQDQETLDELFYIACNVYPTLARRLPPNRIEKYDIVHVVNEIQKGHVTDVESDGDRMTCQGSPVVLYKQGRPMTVKNNDNHNFIRCYDSDKDTVIKWICETNKIKYYRNHVIDEYDMYTGLIAGKQIPLFRVKLLERDNKVYAVYVIDKDIKKDIKIS